MEQLRYLLQSYLDSPQLPSHQALLSLLEGGISVLEGENPSYRPLDSEGKGGGLIDFTDSSFSDLPLVVVPDLHGRGKLLLDLLDYEISGQSILSLLSEGKIFVCCLGDIFHSENRGRDRWKQAFIECQRGNLVNEALREEMLENFSLLEIILSLKSAFASHFHILKGNHENVLNENHRQKYGNVPFRKFCDEGNMVADFIQHYYDDLILHEISCFEKKLPVCAAFNNCLVSHAEPAAFFSKEDIINYHRESSLVTFAFTWTANDAAREGSVAHLFNELLPENQREKAFYFTGHRPVLGKYALRQNGRLVQIHNPDIEQVAALLPGKTFDPERDILEIER
ncbi:MAG: metallophosphoesterase [Treponema sp.]|nr:metallophosphoesterase [Treponema sp.]